MANPYLPEEILLEIFSRLPTKSVGKCRCTSKTWNALLSTKHFINSHFKNQEKNLILVNNQSNEFHMLTLPLKTEREFSKKIKLENNIRPCLLDSCNGLVLLVDNEADVIMVSNPVTRQQVKIQRTRSSSYPSMYGFGYDSLSDDYKVVQVSKYFRHDKLERVTHMVVYCLKPSVRKRVVNPKGPIVLPHIQIDDANLVMPYVNGAVHCLAYKDLEYRTFAFDLDKETFREIQLPTEVAKEHMISLMVLKGCLSFICRIDRYSTDVWMMKDYGNVDSWIKFRLNFNPLGSLVTPICFVGDEQLLCFVDDQVISWGGFWDVHDLKGRTTTRIAAGRIPYSISQPFKYCLFIESLISPEQATVRC